jgi:hypothetical protein
LLLLFDDSDGAVGTQHVPQRVRQTCRALAEAVPDCVRGMSSSVIKMRNCPYPRTYLIIAPFTVIFAQHELPDLTRRRRL